MCFEIKRGCQLCRRDAVSFQTNARLIAVGCLVQGQACVTSPAGSCGYVASTLRQGTHSPQPLCYSFFNNRGDTQSAHTTYKEENAKGRTCSTTFPALTHESTSKHNDAHASSTKTRFHATTLHANATSVSVPAHYLTGHDKVPQRHANTNTRTHVSSPFSACLPSSAARPAAAAGQTSARDPPGCCARRGRAAASAAGTAAHTLGSTTCPWAAL